MPRHRGAGRVRGRPLAYFFLPQQTRSAPCAAHCAAVLLAAALLLLCRFLYLSRYVVYSDDEAYLDFDRTLSSTRDPKQTQNPDVFPFTTLIA